MDDDLLPRASLPAGLTGKGTSGRTFEILSTIERGGMGELFLAKMKNRDGTQQHVVLKRLLADLLDDDKYVTMFRSEAEVMARLDHPNIVRVLDTPIIGGSQCLAMEYIRGRNVQQMLVRHMDLGNSMPPSIVFGVMIEVLRGLEYAHGYHLPDGAPLNLVHRDVTPGNVLVSFDGEVKLTDFGIAKSQMSAVSTTVGIVKGKARYLSPEQILGEPATPRSDVFSAAAVTAEMLTGIPAFDRGSVPKTLYAIVNGEIPDFERILPVRSPLLIQTLRRALETDPGKRIQTALELAESFEAVARLLGTPPNRAAIGQHVSSLFRDAVDPLAELFDDEPETVHGFSPAKVAEPPPPPDPVPSNKRQTILDSPWGAAIPESVVPPRVDSDTSRSSSAPAHGERVADLLDDDETTGNSSRPGPAGPPDLASGSLRAPLESSWRPGPAGPPDLASGSLRAPLESSSGPGPAGPPDLASGSLRAPLASRQPPTDPSPPARSSAERPPPSLVEGLSPPQPSTPVVRGTPIAPEPPGDTRRAVDEALSVLAWLQSRKESSVERAGAPSLKQIATEAAERDDTRIMGGTAKSEVRWRLPAVFAAGLATGVLVTLAISAMTSDPDPDPEREPEVAIEEDPVVEAAPEEPPLPPPPTFEAPPAAIPARVVLDVLYPRGARIQVDGRWLDERAPIQRLELEPGNHRVRITKGRYNREVRFDGSPGEHYVLAKKLIRR
jgi:serine/threonine-protein kinase